MADCPSGRGPSVVGLVPMPLRGTQARGWAYGRRVTIEARRWSEVPQRPGLYAMYGGEPPRTWVAYVGIAGGIQGRLIQHFVRRDSSVVTGTSAVGVNIEHVRFVDWWEHPLLEDEVHRHAAELVAFRVLDPALRSRGNTRQAALALLQDVNFVEAFEQVLLSPPSGRYWPPRIGDLVDRVATLEARLAALEGRAAE